jgi:hypothetical protein
MLLLVRARFEEFKEIREEPVTLVRSMMAMLLIIKQLIHYYPIAKSDLNDLIPLVRPYAFWAKPIGPFARSLYLSLLKESRFAGYNMRWRVDLEASQFFYLSETLQDRTSVSHFFVLQKKDPLVSMLQLSPSSDITVVHDRTPTRAAVVQTLVASLYSNATGTQRQALRKASQQLKVADKRVLLELMAEVTSINEDDTGAPPREHVAAILEDIANWPSTDEKEDSASQTVLGDAPVNARPWYVAHFAEPVSLQEALDHEGPTNGEPTERLRQLIQDIAILVQPGSGDHCILNVVIPGGTRQVNEAMRAYVSLLEAEQVPAGLSLQFFIMPSFASRVGGFLAAHDHWYRRNIWVPLRSNGFCIPAFSRYPDASIKAVGSTVDPTDLCPPARQLSLALDMWTLHARHTCKVQVFTADICTAGSTGFASDLSARFLSSIEIGTRPAAYEEVLRGEIKRHQHSETMLTNADIMAQDDSFRRRMTPPNLVIEFERVTGLTSKHVVAQACTYQDVSITNIHGGRGDLSTPISPLSELLTLYALQDERGKDAGNSCLFAKYQNHQIRSVSIKTGDQRPFSLLLDGILLTGCHSIRVVPTITEELGRVRMPFMTMQPIDISHA